MAAQLEIIQCEQNSDEWLRARLGCITASELDAVMAKGKGKAKNEPSKTRRTYMLKLIGERITGQPAEHFTNKAMERGHEMEPQARELYALLTDTAPESIGFLKRGDVGCSPDSLVPTDGGLEIKTKAPHLLAEIILANKMPPEHKHQVQGSLWIAEREWWDFMAYWPRMPPFIERQYRDELYINSIQSAVNQFRDEMLELLEKIKRFGNPNLKEAA